MCGYGRYSLMAIVLHSALSLDNLKHLANESAESNTIKVQKLVYRTWTACGSDAWDLKRKIEAPQKPIKSLRTTQKIVGE